MKIIGVIRQTKQMKFAAISALFVPAPATAVVDDARDVTAAGASG